MIRLASRISKNNLYNLTYRAKQTNQNILASLDPQNHINASLSSLVFSPLYLFSRKKQNMKFEKNFDEGLDKEYKKQRQRQQKTWQNAFMKMGAMNFLPFFGFAILFLFIKAHVTKKQEKVKEQNEHFSKISERKNVTIIPEGGLRQLILKGSIADLHLEIVRKNRLRGSTQYNTFCFVKQINGQFLASQILHLPDFLMFVQQLPHNYKVSFEYENYRKKDLQSSWVGTLINVAMIAGAVIIGRRLWEGLRGAMKGSGGQGIMDIDTKKIEAIKPENINTLFKDVAGMHEAKFQITEFVDFLKQPEKYIEMGAKVPKGALLTGPPGTGKTLLARACAGQAGVPFYYVSGSDFVEKYVGLGASRVRKLFDEAQKNAPSIIFIDEIDAIGKKRDSGPFANEQRDNTLNQLLVRMDGFDSKNKVIVMAATNIKDTLDPALLRPGRFDRQVQIGVPNFQERKQILQVHLKKVKFDTKFTIEQLANRISILTPGFSGAELANICNEAAILAAREGADMIDMPKFQKATERVMAGLEKRNLFSDEEKLMLCYYECGKAVVGWFTEGSDPIVKLSILPFSKASKGYSHTIKDEIGLTTKEQLLGKVCFYLAGRAAQKRFQGYITTNGDADLKRAKRIISLLVTKFGMSQKLKHIAFPDTEFVRKPYSSQIQIIIDQQIQRITNQCKAKVQELIEQKVDLIQKLKIKLLEKQTLNHAQIKEILGDRPFEANQNYKKYIIEEQKAHQINPERKEEELLQGKMDSNESDKENSQNKKESQINKFRGLDRFA